MELTLIAVAAQVKVPSAAVGAPARAVPFGSTGGVASYYVPSGSYTFTATV